MSQVVGYCSLCGGEVVQLATTRSCSACHAVEAQNLPVIPMRPMHTAQREFVFYPEPSRTWPYTSRSLRSWEI